MVPFGVLVVLCPGCQHRSRAQGDMPVRIFGASKKWVDEAPSALARIAGGLSPSPGGRGGEFIPPLPPKPCDRKGTPPVTSSDWAESWGAVSSVPNYTHTNNLHLASS